MTDTRRAQLAQQLTCAALAMLLVLSEVFSSSLQNTLPQFSHLCRMALTGGAAALLLACMLVPSVRFTEDNDTVLLAKVIYAQCKNEDYSAKLALGREVMRRVDDPWYPATLGEVLREQQQFPAGTRYDSESLRAAHAVIAE